MRKAGGIDLPLIQKFVNFWFSQSLDLHGSEVSSNAAAYFSNGLKGRAEEDKFDDDHVLAANMYVLDLLDDSGRIIREEVPMRNALNEVLRDWYVGDCQAGVDRWNKRVLEAHGMSERIALPSRKFNRKVGVYAGKHFDPFGQPADAPRSGSAASTSGCRRRPTRPTCTASRSTPVYKPGQFANYIAPPQRGINRQPIDFEYVRTEAEALKAQGSGQDCRRHQDRPVKAQDVSRRRRAHDHARRSAGQHLLLRDDAGARRGGPRRAHGRRRPRHRASPARARSSSAPARTSAC